MEVWMKDETGRLLATSVAGRLYPTPGVDRELLAFELFKLMVSLMAPPQPQVTWGRAWAPQTPGA
jgi:hypothetical protein